MNRIAALTMGAGMITMAACSDAPTAAPSAAAYVPKTTSFALGLTNSTPELGKYKICKEGNIGGSFDVTRTGEGGSTGTVSGANTVIQNGTCQTVGEDAGGNGVGSNVSFTEDAADNVVSSITGCKFIDSGGGVSDCAFGDASRFINSFHGFVVTVTNTFTPPPPPDDVCDFSTFGGFVLSPNTVSWGGNAGFATSGFAYGSLNFVNHTTGDHIHVWNVTDYGHPEDGPLSQYEDSRLAAGLASVNGGPVDVPVEWRFVDLGEPAKKVGDAVYLKVGNTVLIPEQVVIGGNIQLHAKCKKAPKAEKH